MVAFEAHAPTVSTERTGWRRRRVTSTLDRARRKDELSCERVPTVLRQGPYRLYFVSHDMSEPPHVHVDRDDLSAKLWLEPVSLARNLGFRPHQLREIERIVTDKRRELLEAWHGYFGDPR